MNHCISIMVRGDTAVLVRKLMLDLLQSKETAQYYQFGTNKGSTLNQQDPCEKDSTDQLADLANPPPTISRISINNILEDHIS